ncbi:hypothetical protein FJY84_02815 [Candidatus Bathyarchaeota archaeon]|nr:hypothetical protein [Candidatus Bathyarchaeota archaeon]
MLKALNYPLGNSGPNQDGVDGDFGSNTEKSVKLFQSTYKDWDDQPLEKDAKIGPRAGDSLNRAMIGLWYDKYETPLELTTEFKLITIIEKLAVTEGIEI